MVAVVQTDAQDLVGAGDGRPDPLVAEGRSAACGHALIHGGAQGLQAARAEEGLIEVGGDVRDVDGGGLVHAHDGSFGAGGYQSHQVHGHSLSVGLGCYCLYSYGGGVTGSSPRMRAHGTGAPSGPRMARISSTRSISSRIGMRYVSPLTLMAPDGMLGVVR